MHVNHKALLALAIPRMRSGGRLLDFGCGAGALVLGAQAEGLDAHGCDVFYDGGKRREEARATGLLGTRIHEIAGGVIPLPDASCDCVVSNQVFEHIPDLEPSLAEIARVLRPGGMLIAAFPTLGTWWEGHRNAPFLHLVPTALGIRFGLAVLVRCLGFGRHVHPPGVLSWARASCEYLQRCTTYRSDRTITRMLQCHLSYPVSLEWEFLVARQHALAGSQSSRLMAIFGCCALGRKVAAWLVRKRANRVLVAVRLAPVVSAVA